MSTQQNALSSLPSQFFNVWVLKKAFGESKLDWDSSGPAQYDRMKDYEKFKINWMNQIKAHQTQNKLEQKVQQMFEDQYKSAFFIHFLAIQLNTCSSVLFFYLFQNIIHLEFHTTSNFIIIALITVIKVSRFILTLGAENKLFLIGQRIYSCLNYAMIDLVLSHSQGEQNSRNLSKIMHLDIQKILHYAYRRSFTINSCISILINAFLLIYLFSWVGFIGFACFLVSFALFVCAIKYGKNLQNGFMEENQKRVHKTIQVFEMIKFIKINVMEKFFYEKLCDLRTKELGELKKIFNFDLVMIAMTVILLKSIILVVCLAAIKNGLEFNSAALFSLYLIFNNISLYNTAKQIKNLKECSLAFSNIEKVLINNPKTGQSIKKQIKADLQHALLIKGSFSWKTNIKSQQQAELKDIDLCINRGDFISIVGQYASGKSSIISAILGSIRPVNDALVQINGSIAYVCQKPFIINATIMENIIFGEEFSQNRYKQAIKYSCLEEDLNILEDKDQTIIGQRGYNLSGGQKARICLARALYRDADIYILDDILSSVDAHVGSFIFNTTIKEYLNHKTVLLVTHSLNLLSPVDKVVIMNAGRVQYFGQYGQITSQGIKSATKPVIRQRQKQNNLQNILLDNQQVYLYDSNKSDQMDDFFLYFTRNGGTTFTIIIIIFLITLALSNSFTMIWINQWANSPDTEITLYVFVTIISIIVTCLCSLVIAKILHNSEIFFNLYSNALSSLLRAPFQFYQKTHFAKIVKILTNDFKIHDRILVASFFTFVTYGSALLSALIIIFGITIFKGQIIMLVASIIFLPIIFYPFFKTLFQSRKLSQQMQLKKIRLSSIFDESVEGKQTLMAHQKIKYQFNLFSCQLQQYCELNLCFNAMGSFTLVSTYITYFLFLFCMLVLCYFQADEATSYYNCALIASVVIGEQKLVMLSQGISQFLLNLKSLRRCNDLTQIDCQEGSEQLKLQHQSKQNYSSYLHNRNENGSIEFQNYSIKYRTRSSYALKNLNLSIKQGERVCLVGRTGSGKSSLILGLVRGTQASEGLIKIGGKDISKMPLNELRMGINVILQQNFLFQGSIRQIIDYKCQSSDERIIQILKKCNIWQSINKKGGLEAFVEERAQNFSAGERQLLSIARAINNPRKIILIDQATSNIDLQTQSKVQSILKECFQGCTVISISHRLSHVKNFDKVLVLNQGEVVEFDAPSILMNDKDSRLYHLLQASNQNDAEAPSLI